MSSLELDISDISFCDKRVKCSFSYGAKKFPTFFVSKKPWEVWFRIHEFFLKQCLIFSKLFREPAAPAYQDLRLGLVYFAGRDKAVGTREQR